MRRSLAILLVSSLLGIAACSLRKPPTGEDYYAQGQANFAEHEYNAAIENYSRLIDYYPFSPYAEDAEMKIGLAHYEMANYAEAISALDDFQRMHPTSKNLDLVSYYIAMSYFDQIGREDQDQGKTEAALQHFELIEQRFPEGSFAELSRERGEICREVLARHDLIVGNFYFKRANLKAAESRLAELLQKYPDTPIAPDALYELATALEKEGKKYSAAQAFEALLKHFPNTPYASKSRDELKKLNQPVDTEEDPLPLVLAESGFPANSDAQQARVVVRQRDAEPSTSELADAGSMYGPDGLPILERPDPKPAAESVLDPPPGPSGRSQAVVADKAPGPATLRTIRLSSTEPPLSVILDLTGPVRFEKRLENGSGYSTATVMMKDVKPAASLEHHLVFDRSIFKDCDVKVDDQATTVTLNTVPVSNFAVVPLDQPPRLLVTFTPQSQAMDHTPGAGL
ncbi:MAG TPA: outer membrane protein assembly factor BamD [Candidatus Binataceae bacterium]|nr:outer membrane protein assembly factor BamD [Candidatus Binataceae bacterium]